MAPSTLRLYRAALQGYHSWSGEQLTFPIKVPHHIPRYIEEDVITKILSLAKDKAKDYLILRLMTDSGLRREEVRRLKVRHVGRKTLRFRGKGDKDRIVPLTNELTTALKPFCFGKAEVPEELAVLCLLTQCGYKAVYVGVRPNIESSLGSNSFYDFSSPPHNSSEA